MTLFKEEEIHTIILKNYNRKDKCSWFVDENVFWIFFLKLLLCKFDLDVVFILDIFIYFVLEHVKEEKISIECLFHIIKLEEITNQTEDILRIMDGDHN
jgi:hypothetical protein